jgi:hypothetical protein
MSNVSDTHNNLPDYFRANAVNSFLLPILGLFKKRTVVSDSEVDALLKSEISRIQSVAKAKLDLSDEIIIGASPLIIKAPIFWNKPNTPASDILWRIGKDNFIRFSIYRIVVIFLTESFVSVYSCDFNFMNSTVVYESTQEYHYKDIVSVSTQVDNMPLKLPDGKQLNEVHTFDLSVASGERVRVVIGVPLSITKGAYVHPTGADYVIKNLRTVLREKKGG